MHTTPVSLLARLRRPGEPAAWGELVELYTPLLLAWARRLGLQEADAADLVQEVLAALVRALPSFRLAPGGSFRAGLRTIALNEWRKRKRRPAFVSLDGAPEPMAEDGD